MRCAPLQGAKPRPAAGVGALGGPREAHDFAAVPSPLLRAYGSACAGGVCYCLK